MGIPVAALYAPLNALFNIYLANRVSSFRMRAKVSIGLGKAKVGAEGLEVAMRMHANNAEFVPLALLLLLMAELAGGGSLWLHIAGGSLLVARLMHAYGMPRPAPNFFRFVGTAVSWIMIAATSVWLLAMRFAG